MRDRVIYKGKKTTAKEALDILTKDTSMVILERIKDSGIATIGKLCINGEFECFTLEDTHRDVKIKHETRIPAGIYEIKLRLFGGHHERYSKHSNESIRKTHKGMLWLQDVPNFTDILIHIGNSHKDTSGCILVGRNYVGDRLEQSTLAYADMYPKILKLLELGPVFIEIRDEK